MLLTLGRPLRAYPSWQSEPSAFMVAAVRLCLESPWAGSKQTESLEALGCRRRATDLVIWSTTWLTCVPPFTVQMELTKLTCSRPGQAPQLAPPCLRTTCPSGYATVIKAHTLRRSLAQLI